MAEVTFSQAFKDNMNAMGLPVPTTIYATLATTLGTVGALAGGLAKVGASATVAELFLTVPVAAGATASAAAVSEIVAACGAVAASFYVGACIGSVLVAAYETLDVNDLMKVVAWVREVSGYLEESVDHFLELIVSSNGRASPIRPSIVLAKKLA